MRLVPKDKNELFTALIGHDDRKVEADKDTGISAATVKDLLAMASSSGGLVVETPNAGFPLARATAERARLAAAP